MTGAGDGTSDVVRLMAAFSLSYSEAVILDLLMRREVAAHQGIWASLYGLRPDGGPVSDPVKVFVRRLRCKLRPLGVEIIGIRGAGYRLAAGARAVLKLRAGEALSS